MLTKLTKSFEDKIIYHNERVEHFNNVIQLIDEIDINEIESIIMLSKSDDKNNWDLAKQLLISIHPKMWMDIIANVEELRNNMSFRFHCGIQLNPFNDNDYGVYSTSTVDVYL